MMKDQAPSGERFLGTKIVVTTTFGEEMEGEIFCYDIEKSNSVILRSTDENGVHTYKWLKTNIIRDVKAISCAPSNSMEERLPPINFSEITKQSLRAEAKAQQEMKYYGVGVTDRAQQIFDSLNKTMDCKWNDTTIEIFGVRISEPYKPENCSGGDTDKALDRIKKVLDATLNKMDNEKNDSKKNKPTADETAGNGWKN